MGACDLLRRIDQRTVPPLADALHRLVHGPSRLRLPLLVGLIGAAIVVAGVTGGRSPVSQKPASDLVQVGVPQGRSIPGYLDDSNRELIALASAKPSGDMYALVTLSAYLAPERLAPVVGGLSAAAVYARVPLPLAQTEIVRIDAFRVPQDVLAGMDQVAVRKDGEVLDYRELSAKLTGRGAQERRLRAVYDTGARVAAAEAEAYRHRCSCVYAVVVRASPAALVRVAGRGEVRAVDPAPAVRRLDRAVFLPPLPEQAGTARLPEDGVPADRSPEEAGAVRPPSGSAAGGGGGRIGTSVRTDVPTASGIATGALNLGGPVRAHNRPSAG